MIKSGPRRKFGMATLVLWTIAAVPALTLAEDYYPPPESQGGWRKNVDPEFIRSRGLDPVHVDEIHKITEAALSSSSRAIIPIIKIDGQKVGLGHPGPITRRLLRAYQDVVAQVIRPAYEEENYK